MNNVKLVMVSIGTPDVGKKLSEHLGIKDADSFIFADPDNSVYDELNLNKGISVTLFNPATPFAIFRDRVFKQNGMNELSEVLAKWSNAFFIPPKREQGFIQGGTFIFNGNRTLYAHYDEATGAHPNIETVVKLAIDASY